MSRRVGTRPAWARLDNASNIFLAARSDVDSKVFRLAAEVDHEVDPALLQEALDAVCARFPIYHAVLRRGVFWHYLQDSALHPEVTAENQYTCAPIYQPDRRTLLFRLVHHRRRITLEVFHALSDGTGALWFLTDVVTSYLRLCSAEDDRPADAEADTEALGADLLPAPASSGVGPVPAAASAGAVLSDADDAGTGADPVHELTADSFAHYFRKPRRRERRRSGGEPEAFLEGSGDAESGHRTAPPREATPPPEAARPPETAQERLLGLSAGRAHRVKGTRTPDNRTRAVELTMPAADVLALARAERTSLTMYLTALFFEAIRTAAEARSPHGLGRRRTVAASVPVNLRQFFPSSSPRNFFTTVRVAHTYGQGADDLSAICRSLEGQFRPQTAPAALEKKLRRFIRFERMPLLRIVPRGAKDLLLRLINALSNRGLTVAVSNLGRVSLPEPAESRVGRMLFHVSAVRPQFCAVSHGGLLTVTFTSPFTETDHVREFARMLTGAGVPVTVASARVTEQELAEAALAELAQACGRRSAPGRAEDADGTQEERG